MWWRSIIIRASALVLSAKYARGLWRAALSLFVFACLDLFLYGFLVAPSAALLKLQETQYGDLKRHHAEAVLFEKQKPSFVGIMAGVPSQKDMPLLVKDLVQAAKRLNLAVASVKYDIPKQTNGELAMLAFSFPAEGGYPDLKRFIYDVETADRLVGIQSLKLEADQGKVKLDMKLVTYVKGL
jgi:Tfp pilus assembly protein PilO